MEFSKKKLISIMEEVKSMDVDEMARRRFGDRAKDINKETGEVKIPKVYNIWKDDNPTPKDANGSPDGYVINYEQLPGEQFIVVPIGCAKESEFIEQNREWLESIGVEYEVDLQKFKYCSGKKIPKDVPNKYRPPLSGEKMSLNQLNFRKFLNIVRREFDQSTNKGAEFYQVLERLSIPCISSDTKHMDRHSDKPLDETYRNNRIVFRTHSYDNYTSVQEFLKTVIKRIKGEKIEKDPENHCTYQARQYNKIYNTWSDVKPTIQDYSGTTAVYGLDKLGFTEKDINVSVRIDFEIIGERMNDVWNWTIKMKHSYGKKTPSDFMVRDGLETYTLNSDGYLGDKTLTVNKQIPYPQKDFTQTDIMGDISIVSSLEEAILDFKNLVKNIEPKSALSIANITRKDIGKLNETVNSVVKNIKKLKNGKSS